MLVFAPSKYPQVVDIFRGGVWLGVLRFYNGRSPILQPFPYEHFTLAELKVIAEKLEEYIENGNKYVP